MTQPTSSLTNFVGPLYASDTPPTAAIVGKPLEEGMVYLDTGGPTSHLCVYYNGAWRCESFDIAISAATSTSTTTTTTTTTTTSTSTTTTAT